MNIYIYYLSCIYLNINSYTYSFIWVFINTFINPEFLNRGALSINQSTGFDIRRHSKRVLYWWMKFILSNQSSECTFVFR